MYLFSSIHYLNGKKIGSWEYYQEGGGYKYASQTEQYHADGSITVSDYLTNSTIKYSGNSSTVSGFILMSNDTITIECNKKDNRCLAVMQNECLFDFSFDHLLMEVEKISTLFYLRGTNRKREKNVVDK